MGIGPGLTLQLVAVQAYSKIRLVHRPHISEMQLSAYKHV